MSAAADPSGRPGAYRLVCLKKLGNRMWEAWDMIFLFVLRVFFRIANWVVRLVLSLILRTRKRVLPPPHDVLLLKSASQLAEDIRNQKVKSEAVVRAYVVRIGAVQPHINAMIDERFSLALEEARQADLFVLNSGLTVQELAHQKPFLGVPFTIKGSLACKGMVFNAGSPLRQNLRADHDAEVVSLLRRSGAIPLALSNLPPLCVGFSTENPLYGITWNPYDLRRLPGGSSGGEAALLASAASVLGLANDLAGSLRVPACLCGVFAHKPTSGTVSSEGFFTLVRNGTEDVLINGPMCRYAEDLLPVLRILIQDYCSPKLDLLRKVDLKTVKIYYMNQTIDNPGVNPVSQEVKIKISKLICHLQSAYEVKVEELTLPHLKNVVEIWQAKLSKSSLVTDSGRGFFEIIWELCKSFLGCSPETTLTLWHALNKKIFGKRTARMFPLYRQMGLELEEILKKVLEDEDNPSVLLFPAAPGGAPYRMEEGLNTYMLAYFMLFSALGLPVTQCPLGLNREGLPIGLQVVGGRHKDRVTLAVAREIEKAFGGWQQPAWGQPDKPTSNL